jgi:hypothetical protein
MTLFRFLKLTGGVPQPRQNSTSNLLGSKQSVTMDHVDPNSTPAQNTVQGYFEYKYINRNGKTYGPYLYLRFYEGKIKKSQYLGKVKA